MEIRKKFTEQEVAQLTAELNFFKRAYEDLLKRIMNAEMIASVKPQENSKPTVSFILSKLEKTTAKRLLILSALFLCGASRKDLAHYLGISIGALNISLTKARGTMKLKSRSESDSELLKEALNEFDDVIFNQKTQLDKQWWNRRSDPAVRDVVTALCQ